MLETPIQEHLGGHGNKTWVDSGALKYIVDKFSIFSMVDLGCGPGGMKRVANELGIHWHGIDGDPTFKGISNYIIIDFANGSYIPPQSYDLCWSVEFLEHVEEKYIENYLPVIISSKYLFCTASPDPKGHHHVNVKPKSYWIELFGNNGVKYLEKETESIVKASTMPKKKRKNRSFVQESGMFFKNEN